MPQRTTGDERRSPLDEFSRTLSNFGMDVDHLERLAAAARFMEHCEWTVLRLPGDAAPDEAHRPR